MNDVVNPKGVLPGTFDRDRTELHFPPEGLGKKMTSKVKKPPSKTDSRNLLFARLVVISSTIGKTRRNLHMLVHDYCTYICLHDLLGLQTQAVTRSYTHVLLPVSLRVLTTISNKFDHLGLLGLGEMPLHWIPLGAFSV
eukprot:1294059-Amphidinium_carterae.2